MNNVGKNIADLVAMPEALQIVQPKNLVPLTKNERGRAKLHYGLPKIVYFCNCENNHHLGATIIFDCVYIPSSLTRFKSINDSCESILCL